MIISASRRTDIPAFYAEWFMERIRAGYCTVPNPFNAKQVSRVSLAPEDVDAIVFWTRNPRPLLPMLKELDGYGYSYLFQYTVLDYPRWLEASTPPVENAIRTFRELSDRVGSQRVIWRYDPIVLTHSIDVNYHQGSFARIANALSGCAERVVVSLMDDYAKTRKRLRMLGDEAPTTKQALDADKSVGPMMRTLVRTAKEHHMKIQCCAETLDLEAFGVRRGKCIDEALLGRLFGIDVPDKKDPSQRPQCGCVASKDIGMYNSCLFGCTYCYATSNFSTAQARYAHLDAHSSSLLTTNSST